MAFRDSLMRALGFKHELKPSDIAALTEALSTPVSDPTLGHIISSLPSCLRRGRNSHSSDLCSAHARLVSGPLVEVSNLLTYELHPRLAHLYQYPHIYLSNETQTYLYQTLRQYRIYFREQPSSASDRQGDGESTLGKICLACTISLFLRDEAAVKALAVCAKSRRHRGGRWPSVLDVLERGEKNGDWEQQWRQDGANMRRDRRNAKTWRHLDHENEKNVEECLEVEWGTEPSNENARWFTAWVDEQAEQVEQLAAEGSCPGQEPYDIHPNPFTDVDESDPNPFADVDEGEYAPGRIIDEYSRSNHSLQQGEQEDQYTIPDWRRR